VKGSVQERRATQRVFPGGWIPEGIGW